jgi:hypothetical protein
MQRDEVLVQGDDQILNETADGAMRWPGLLACPEEESMTRRSGPVHRPDA